MFVGCIFNEFTAALVRMADNLSDSLSANACN